MSRHPALRDALFAVACLAVILAIPLFVFMGYVLERSGILVEWVDSAALALAVWGLLSGQLNLGQLRRVHGAGCRRPGRARSRG